MLNTEVLQRFTDLEHRVSFDAYNYDHFHSGHLVSEVRTTLEHRGIPPGTTAPDFELPRVDGGSLRLSALRGPPVLLHFGSLT